MTYVLRALDREGNVMFYTGSAGMNWLSSYPYEAFEFPDRGAADCKAKFFNRMEKVHGYWFIVQTMEQVV